MLTLISLHPALTDTHGKYSIDYVLTGIDENASSPKSFYLSNAYPNPFNPSTRIDFSSPANDAYTIEVFNILGQRLYTSVFDLQPSNYTFDVSGLGSAGIYFFRISSSKVTYTRKLMLLDGGSGDINVSLVSGQSKAIRKQSDESIKVVFEKDGFISKDTIVIFQSNLSLFTILSRQAI